MKTIKMSNLNKFRVPTWNEKTHIDCIVQRELKQIVKISRNSSVIFMILGFMMICSIIVYGFKLQDILYVIFGASFALMSLRASRNVKSTKNQIQGILQGEYLVLDGKAIKVENSNRIGYMNIWFQSNDQSVSVGTYEVSGYSDKQDEKKWLEMLLVYPTSERTQQCLPRVFSKMWLE